MRERADHYDRQREIHAALDDTWTESLADTEAILHTETAPLFPRPRMVYDDEGMATQGSDPAVALGIVLLIALVLGAVGLVFILMHVGGATPTPCPVPGVPA